MDPDKHFVSMLGRHTVLNRCRWGDLIQHQVRIIWVMCLDEIGQLCLAVGHRHCLVGVGLLLVTRGDEIGG